MQDMAEMNKPWKSRTKAMYQIQLCLLYNGAKVTYSSALAEHDSTYHPGGTLVIVAGNAAVRVRVQKYGNDDLGRFC